MRTVLPALAALLFWSGTAYAEDRAPDYVAQAAPESFTEAPMLSQGDPAWSALSIGNTTVGRSGCLAIALMDVLSRMGLVYASPTSFIGTLSRYGLFTRSGLLSWDLGRLFPVSARRFMLAGSAAFQAAVAQLSTGAGVLLEVVTDRGTHHWLVASRIVGNDIEVRDPNGGRTGMLSSLYGISSLRGLATIARM